MSTEPGAENKDKARRPVVGIAGFYGHGNFGDELFYDVFEQYLGGDFELRILPDLTAKPYFSSPVDKMVDQVDAIVIGGGDIVQPWGVDPRYFNRAYLKRPVFIAGVGVPLRANAAQQRKDWAVEKYKAFLSDPMVKFIHARDSESVNWIRKNAQPIIEVHEAPDIVCSLDLPPAPKLRVPTLGIVTRLRPGHADDDDYSMLQAMANRFVAEGWAIRHIVLGTGEVGRRDRADADKLYVPEKELFVSESLKDLCRAIGSCEALASMKFHGTVVATMYGVPSMVLIPTSKNRNFMRRIEREDLLSKFDAPDLLERCDALRIKIAPDSVRFLRTQSQQLMSNLRDALTSTFSDWRKL
jgi:polysaccharide pyruvyl transferase WcaK-like protein